MSIGFLPVFFHANVRHQQLDLVLRHAFSNATCSLAWPCQTPRTALCSFVSCSDESTTFGDAWVVCWKVPSTISPHMLPVLKRDFLFLAIFKDQVKPSTADPHRKRTNFSCHRIWLLLHCTSDTILEGMHCTIPPTNIFYWLNYIDIFWRGLGVFGCTWQQLNKIRTVMIGNHYRGRSATSIGSSPTNLVSTSWSSCNV